MKRIRLLIASVVLSLSVGMIALPALSFAGTPSPDTSKSEVCTALGSNSDCSTTPAGSVGLNSTVSAVVNILSLIVGVVAVVMIIVAGIRFVTAGGDANNVSAARSTLIYALVGLVVVGVAQGLVQFVLKKVT